MSKRSIRLIQAAWVLASAATAALWRVEALVLLVPLAFLGPVLREVRRGAAPDERERAVDYHARHLALLVVFLLLFVLFAQVLLVKESQPPPEWYLILAVPLLVRMVLSVGRGSGSRRLGLVLGFSFGGIWLAFTLVSHGFSAASLVESSVGGVIHGRLRSPTTILPSTGRPCAE
jgi:hypothetical protein